jgi:hypothetical protein
MTITGGGPINEELPRLPVVRTLGGCGGTLLARFFGALSGTVVLSECNPRSAALYGGLLNPIRQIQDWHPELYDSVAGFDCHEIGYPPRFGEMLECLYVASKETRRPLIVRDYNYVDFIGIPYVWPAPNDFSLDIAIAGRFEIKDFLFVRSPAAQLASLRSHNAIRPVLTAEHFLSSYLAFLAAKPDTPIFRYEDFVADPGATFQKMCGALGIGWDPAVVNKYLTVGTVTGNFKRNADSSINLPAPSIAAASAQSELIKLPGYCGLLEALGYKI